MRSAAKHNLHATESTPQTLALHFTDAEGEDLDLTGYTLTGAVEQEGILALECVFTDASNATVEFPSLAAGRAIYDLFLRDGTGKEYPLIFGAIHVLGRCTPPAEETDGDTPITEGVDVTIPEATDAQITVVDNPSLVTAAQVSAATAAAETATEAATSAEEAAGRAEAALEQIPVDEGGNVVIDGALTVGGVVNANGGINCPADLTLSGDLSTPSGCVSADELKSNEAVAEYYWGEVFEWNTANVAAYFKSGGRGYKRLPKGTPFPAALDKATPDVGISGTMFEELPDAWVYDKKTSGSSFLDGCKNLKKLPDGMVLPLISNGTAMFRNTKLTHLPAGMTLSGVTNGNALFQYCAQLVDVGGLTLDNLENGNAAFYGCSKLTVVNATFDKVTDGGNMFAGCTALVSLPNVNLASLSAGGTMFYNCKALSAESIIQALSTLKDWTGDSGEHVIRFTGSPALKDADVLAAKAGAEAKGWTVNFS